MINLNLFFGFLLFSLFRMVMETVYPVDAMGVRLKVPKDEPLEKSIAFVVCNFFGSVVLFGILWMFGNFLFGLIMR